MTKKAGIFLVVLIVLGLVIPCASMAQRGVQRGAQSGVERGVPVTERKRTDFDPFGIRVGAFILNPELAVGMIYNDNVYATEDEEVSDWVNILAPSLEVRSNWSVHSIGLDAGLNKGIYLSESDENYTDSYVMLDGRVDVLRQSFLTARAGFERLHEPRNAYDTSLQWDEPSVYNRTSGHFSYYHGVGRISVTGGAGIIRYDFRSVEIDGVSVAQDFRDRDIYDVNARVTYDIHPDVKPFILAHHEWRVYDRSEVERDSQGYRIGAGTGFDLGGVTSMEIYAGYLKQDFDDRNNISGPWFGLSLLWNPGKLTSVQATALTSVKETTVANASGIEAFDGSLRVDHEVRRNLLAGLFFDYIHHDYNGVEIRDEYYEFGPRVTYLLNRYLSAEAGYTHRIKESNVAQREYSQNIFDVAVFIRF